MKLFILKSLAWACLAFFFASCNSSTTYEDALNYNRENIEEPKKVEDAIFLVKAKSLTQLQISLLQLSQEKGYSSATVSLGKDNIELFRTLESDIIDVAKKKDIRLGDKMDPAHYQLYQELSGADKASFDQKFVFSLKSINDQELKLFESHATTAFDPDIRAFAARSLGQLRTQAGNLDKVEKELIPISQ
jgi:putative membrane protein